MMAFEPKKRCAECNEVKSIYDFPPSVMRLDGMNSYCRVCFNEQKKRFRSTVPMTAKHLTMGAKYRAEKKGIPFDLTTEFVEHGIIAGCALTGIAFNLQRGRGKAWDGPSIDRVEAGAAYTQSNCRIILYGMNALLGSWGEMVAMEMVKAWIKKEKL